MSTAPRAQAMGLTPCGDRTLLAREPPTDRGDLAALDHEDSVAVVARNGLDN